VASHRLALDYQFGTRGDEMVENQRVARREELRYWKPKWLELVEVLTPLPKNYSRIVPTVCSIGIMTSQAVY
jgi:hypothetical protein